MSNKFHPTAKISPLSSIEVSSRGTDTIIGQNSVVDDFVKIKHVGGTGDITLGDYVYLNSGTVLYSGNGIKIGNDVLIGPNCNLVPTNHNFSDVNELIRNQGFQESRGGIVIENNVWLGANVTVLDGAIIREGCIVAANSLVYGDTEKFGVYMGVPAKKIKSRL